MNNCLVCRYFLPLHFNNVMKGTLCYGIIVSVTIFRFWCHLVWKLLSEQQRNERQCIAVAVRAVVV